MKILKRNQIIISVIALMLITVGYMSFSSNLHNSVETGALMDAEKMAGIGDAKLVNSNNVTKNEDETNNKEDIDNTEEAELEEDSGNDENHFNSNQNTPGEIQTAISTSTYQADYFVSSRLERDKMYSQMLETYQGLMENTNIAADQKNTSTQEITKINNKKNSIMIAENLIKNLGFEDVVIFVNDNSTSVIVKAEKLSEADIAQIQNIVCREIGVKVEDIHISVK